MLGPESPVRRIVALLSVSLAAWIASGEPARADRILLRGGGQVKGKLVADPAHPGGLILIGEVGKTPLTLKKDQIVHVTLEKGPLDEYVERLEQPRSTAADEMALAAWCEEHHLRDLAQVHYAAALKRDDTLGEAHAKVGHVLMDGRWLDADEVKEAQGMVKYKGRWMLPEEKDKKESQVALASEGASWAKRVKLLRDSYQAGPESRSRDAEARLLAIREPVAVVPVLRVLGEDPVPFFRAMAARILGAIPGPEADRGLVSRLLAETEQPVREATVAELARRDAAEIVPMLARALRSARPEVVNRAAWGLAQLNAVSAVPRLIPSLITIEYKVVMAAEEVQQPGGIGVSFGSVNNAGVVGNGGIGSVGGGSFAALTAPAVAPGAVAYGAVAVPYGALDAQGFAVGTGGPPTQRIPVPRMVPIEHHNAEVLNALVKMTGRDFGFDVASWKRWSTASFRTEAAPSRRVPQP